MKIAVMTDVSDMLVINQCHLQLQDGYGIKVQGTGLEKKRFTYGLGVISQFRLAMEAE